MSFLDNIQLLSSLNQSEKMELEAMCQERYVKNGEIIFHEADEANAMYILKQGSINIYKTLEGKQVFLGTVHAQEILGEMALFSENNKRMATGIAGEDSVVITLLAFSFKKMAEANSEIMQKIQGIIQERIVKNQQIESKFRGI